MRFSGDVGADLQDKKLFAAQLQQLFCREMAAVIIVGGNARDSRSETAVDRHNGERPVHLQLRAVGQGDDAVGLVLPHHDKALAFRLGVVVGDHQDAAVTPPGQTGCDLVRQNREKRVAQRRKDQSDTVCAVGPEPAGITVHPVAQPACRVLDALPVVLAHGDPVENLGYRSERNAGLPRHILHCGRAAVCFHAPRSFRVSTPALF